MAGTRIPQVPEVSDVPQRQTAPPDYSKKMDKCLLDVSAALVGMNVSIGAMNTLAGEVEENAGAIEAAKVEAEAAAGNAVEEISGFVAQAQQSASAAAAILGATPWEEDEPYKIGRAVWGDDGNVYTVVVPSTGVDPVTDTTHTYWQRASGLPPAPAGDATLGSRNGVPTWIEDGGDTPGTLAELDHHFVEGERFHMPLAAPISAPAVSVIKKIPHTDLSTDYWDARADERLYEAGAEVYASAITASADFGTVTLTLDAEVNWRAEDRYKTVVLGDGRVTLTSFVLDGEGQPTAEANGYVTRTLPALTAEAGAWTVVSAVVGDNGISLSGIPDGKPYSFEEEPFVEGEYPATCLYRAWFSRDGLNAYGFSGTMLYHYTLTSPYDLTTAIEKFSVDISNQAQGVIRAVALNPDGTRIFAFCYREDGLDIFEYTLTSPFELDTLLYQGVNTTISLTVNSPSYLFSVNIADSGDMEGRLMTIASWAYGASTPYQFRTYKLNSDFEWKLASNWSIQSTAATSSGIAIQNAWFNDDGKELYITYNLLLYRIIVSVPWQLQSQEISAVINSGVVIHMNTANPNYSGACVRFSHDGKYCILPYRYYDLERVKVKFRMYRRDDAFSLPVINRSAAHVDYISDNTLIFRKELCDLSFVDNITKAVFVGFSAEHTSDTIVAWTDVKTDSSRVFDIESPGIAQSKFNLSSSSDALTAIGNANHGLRAICRPDGLEFWLVNLTSAYQKIARFTLSTPWNFASAQYRGIVFDFTTLHDFETANPYGYAFAYKLDGSGIFLLKSPRILKYYPLTTPWDFSTIVDSDIEVSFPTNVMSIGFSADGRYLSYNCGNAISIAMMSSQWDITTLSWLGAISQTTKALNWPAADYSKIFLQTSPAGDELYYVANYPTAAANPYKLALCCLPLISPGNAYLPDVYAVAATNSRGQLYTKYWTALRSISALYSDHGKELYVAFSADGRETWAIPVAGDSARPVARNSGGSYEYNASADATPNWQAADTQSVWGALAQAATVEQNRLTCDQLNTLDNVALTELLGDTLDVGVAMRTDTTSQSPYLHRLVIEYDSLEKTGPAILEQDYTFDVLDQENVEMVAIKEGSYRVRVS